MTSCCQGICIYRFWSKCEVVMREYDELYDITKVSFANGLRQNVKPTKLATGRVELDLQYGTGFQFFSEKMQD